MRMRKNKLIFIIAVILIGFIFTFLFLQPKSPVKALEKECKNEKAILRCTDLIKQIELNSKESLLFYVNGRGNVNCAVSEKKVGGYKIIKVFSELNSRDEELRVGLLGGTLKGNQYSWIYFGIIYDNSVKKVVWNNTEAKKFSTPKFEMLYAVGEGNFEGNDYQIYDSNGKELDHWANRKSDGSKTNE